MTLVKVQLDSTVGFFCDGNVITEKKFNGLIADAGKPKEEVFEVAGMKGIRTIYQKGDEKK
jgi:hypothetical protein